ncbi:MAG: hypothetical protein ACRDQZ_04535, partial [Mycobacteriales bacterium]
MARIGVIRQDGQHRSQVSLSLSDEAIALVVSVLVAAEGQGGPPVARHRDRLRSPLTARRPR